MSTASELREDLILGIEDHIRELAILATDATGYDPGTQTVRDGEPTAHPGIGKVGSYSERLIDGDRIRSSDRLITFIPSDLTCPTPEAGWYVNIKPKNPQDAPEILVVVAAKKREAEGEVICFSVQARTA